MLGIQFNAPKEALHQLSGIPTIEMHHLGSIFTYCRMAAANDSLMKISNHSKSKLQQKVKSTIVKLKGRSIQLQEIIPADFKKSVIQKTIKHENRRRWKIHLTIGECSTGLLHGLDPLHLERYPLPLTISRRQAAILVGLLTGHINLQSHLYRLGLTFTPTCTCLEEDETPRHYLYHCKNHKCLREITNQ